MIRRKGKYWTNVFTPGGAGFPGAVAGAAPWARISSRFNRVPFFSNRGTGILPVVPHVSVRDFGRTRPNQHSRQRNLLQYASLPRLLTRLRRRREYTTHGQVARATTS